MTSKLGRLPRFIVSVIALSVALASHVLVGVAQDRAATLRERVSGADEVVVARARTVSPTWRSNAFGDRLIVSRVLLDVEESLKGEAHETLWLEVEGGTLDGLTLRVSDVPQVRPDDRAVFFLDKTESSVHSLHLRGQGMLMLDEHDAVRGTNVQVDDIRRLARPVGR
jgi:hypothetical protein